MSDRLPCLFADEGREAPWQSDKVVCKISQGQAKSPSFIYAKKYVVESFLSPQRSFVCFCPTRKDLFPFHVFDICAYLTFFWFISVFHSSSLLIGAPLGMMTLQMVDQAGRQGGNSIQLCQLFWGSHHQRRLRWNISLFQQLFPLLWNPYFNGFVESYFPGKSERNAIALKYFLSWKEILESVAWRIVSMGRWISIGDQKLDQLSHHWINLSY